MRSVAGNVQEFIQPGQVAKSRQMAIHMRNTKVLRHVNYPMHCIRNAWGLRIVKSVSPVD